MEPIGQFDCGDIRIRDDNGSVLFEGPRFLRCTHSECGELITHAMIQGGGCTCGGRRVKPAVKVKDKEKTALILGEYPLLAWEWELLNAQT